MPPPNTLKCYCALQIAAVMLDSVHKKKEDTLPATTYVPKHTKALKKMPLTLANLLCSLSPAGNFQNFNTTKFSPLRFSICK